MENSKIVRERTAQAVRHIAKHWPSRHELVRESPYVKLPPGVEPVLEALSDEAQSDDQQIIKSSVFLLLTFGEPGSETVEKLLANASVGKSRALVDALGEVGESGLALLGSAVEDERTEVRDAAAWNLGYRYCEEARGALEQSLVDEDAGVRSSAARGLVHSEASPFDLLEQASRDTNRKVRQQVATRFVEIGEPAREALMLCVADPDGQVREQAILGLYRIGIDDRSAVALAVALEDPIRRNIDTALQLIASGATETDTSNLADAIIEQLVVRDGERPSDHFNPVVTGEALECLISRSPRLHGRIVRRLRDVAYDSEDSVRERSVSVAKNLDPDEFALQVKARMREDPDAAGAIMNLLGGSEASAFFAAAPRQELDRFRAPLKDLEHISRERWNELTKQGRLSLYVSIAMNVTVFVFGVAVVIVGLVILTRSDVAAVQISAGLLSTVASVATVWSRKFWQDPVENIQRYSAQQARLQTAFIGYMNRVAQLRLVFEDQYATDGVTIDDLERYNTLLSEATKEATEQLAFHGDLHRIHSVDEPKEEQE